jgi:ArsR family transcriptional regulator
MEALDTKSAALAGRFAALAHPARLEILRHLADMECCCCKDVVSRLDLAQSTVSQHLKVLVEAGLVRLTPNGQRSLYQIDRHAFSGLSDSFGELLSTCCAPGAKR